MVRCLLADRDALRSHRVTYLYSLLEIVLQKCIWEEVPRDGNLYLQPEPLMRRKGGCMQIPYLKTILFHFFCLFIFVGFLARETSLLLKHHKYIFIFIYLYYMLFTLIIDSVLT